MKQIDSDYVLRFVRLQYQLVRSVKELCPDAKDLKWLLDFPSNGELQLEGEKWTFTKHGAGLRFIRQTTEPHLVVDIHRSFGEPNLIDDWRLLQFLESLGEDVDKGQLKSLLNEMCSEGQLVDQNGGYLFVG